MAKFRVIINKELCKGCSYCITSCPKGLIGLSNDINKSGYHFAIFVEKESCMGCGFCYQVCPEIAIEVIEENEKDIDERK